MYRELESYSGFVKISETEYPFIFDKERFILKLIPPTQSIMNNACVQELAGMGENKGYEIVGDIKCCGIVTYGVSLFNGAACYNVIFSLKNNPFMEFGFYRHSYSIKKYVCFIIILLWGIYKSLP